MALTAINPWKSGGAVVANQLVCPTSATKPRYFKATAGAPGTMGVTEPTWPASGTVTDNGLTWTFQGPMQRGGDGSGDNEG